MQYELTEEQVMLRDMVRRLARERVAVSENQSCASHRGRPGTPNSTRTEGPG
jgi:hypothetical protein